MPSCQLQSNWNGLPLRQLCAVFTSFALVAGCAAQPGLAPDAAVLTRLSSANLFANVEALGLGKRQAIADAIGGLSLSQYYDLMLSHASSAATAVDEVTFANSLANLKASRSTFLLLGTRFHSVGSLWQHLGIQPATMSYNQFRGHLEGLSAVPTASEEANFELLDWSVRQNLSDPCQRRIDRITDLFGFGANDIAGALTTWENNGFVDSTTQSHLGSVTVTTEGHDGLHLEFSNPGGDNYTGTNRFVNCFQDGVDGQGGGQPSGSSGSSLSTQILLCAAISYASSVCSKLKPGN